jgi:uncharacterized protein (DUF927 family)
MFDLLQTVLPPEGRYCVLGLGRYPDQNLVDNRDEVEEHVRRLVRGKADVYFGCAKYGALNNRKTENALYFRALWIDIDCGPTKAVPDEHGVIKGYIDQQAGLTEFKRFCQTAGLPRPILVSSGYGIHAYWLIGETIGRQQWRPLADRLHELCVEHGLIVDPSVFEPSRVLRIPGTFNFKDKETPKPVEVMNEHTQVLTYEQWAGLLGSAPPDPDKPDFVSSGMSPMMRAMMGNREKRFKQIMMKSAEGTGCAQLLHCYQNQADIDEPLWRSALSIAAFCEDGESAAHKMSDQYPGYDSYEVTRKVADLRANGGPHHCTTFEKLNPGGCEGCPHKGKIKSPIILGLTVAEAELVEGEYEVEDKEGEVQHIPEYPFPFFRGKNGGIYKQPKDDEEEAAIVYEHDLYVHKLLTDPEDGEVALFRLHLPLEGRKEFAIPLVSVSTKDELRKALAKRGVMAFPKQNDNLHTFVTAFVKTLQYKMKAEIMRTQFGWTDNDAKIILGDKEITKDGVFYSPPSHATRTIAEKMEPKGSLELWKEVFNMYGRPGLEPNAFAALTAFGSPLLRFTGMSGAIINVIHRSSGSGKSTALYMCNSVIGHPVGLASIWKDTQNAKMHRLGVMNNFANTIDEITNTSPMEFSDLAYSISQGRGKDRMRSQSNELRLNHTKWQGITLCSSNASFYEKLGAAKDSPDGESMRLLEYQIQPSAHIGVTEGKAMFDHQLQENYGHAGVIYAEWLVKNLEEAKDLIKNIQAKIDRETKMTSRERFWSAAAACNIAGGLIAKHLGLHDYDMKAIYAWLLTMLQGMRQEVKPPQSNPILIVGEFLNAHMNNALVVNGVVDGRSNLHAAPILEPRGELMVRFEPDSKHLYITLTPFRAYCVKLQINFRDLLSQLKDAGVYVDTVNKRMAKGMRMDTPAVRTLLFDTTNFEALQMDTIAAQADENRERAV